MTRKRLGLRDFEKGSIKPLRAESEPVGFLSYVRSDDQHDHGNISRIRERLEGECRVRLGRDFSIFQDRNDIRWGQQWEQRIKESILSVTFLFPIITPSFFNSPPCRDEFLAFHLKEQQNGFNNLILPIYYVDCDQLDDTHPTDGDTIVEILRARQWTDWRPFRFRDFREADLAAEISKMAVDIKATTKRIEAEIDAEIQSQVRPRRPHKDTSLDSHGDLEAAAKRLASSKFSAPTEPWSIEVPEVMSEGVYNENVMAAMRRRPYYAFTKAHDEEVLAQDLTTPNDLSRLMPQLAKFAVSLPPAHTAAALKPFKKSTAVTILLDNSGSLRGEPIVGLAASATLLVEWLDARGALTEALGYTTKAWKGGQSREDWIAAGRPPQPGRLNDIRHIIYKSFSQSAREALPNLALMMREGLLKENIDGEALLWAQARLQAQAASNKILVLISDGAPVDDSTLAMNRGTMLEEHLMFAIEHVQAKGTKLIGVGISHDISRYIKDSVIVSDISDVLSATREVIEKIG